MKKSHVLSILAIVLLCAATPVLTSAGKLNDTRGEEVFRSPDLVVAELYKLVTFDAGTMPDWEKVKDLFVDEAVIVLRLGPTTLRTFNRQSFVDYFIYDIERANLRETGFAENILNTQMTVIKDIAHCFVLYEVIVPGRYDDKPVNRGIDSFQLIKKDDLWKIASIINEGFRMSESVPAFIQKK
jgi:hypothetical protein